MSEFIIGIRNHKTLGFIASAYMAERNNDEFYKITEPITLSVLDKRGGEFNKNQKKIIQLIENYSGTNLTKIFAKGKSNARQFLQNVDKNTVETRIRPFVETNLVKIIEILRVSSIKIFHKADNYSTVYNADEIILQKKPAKTLFNIIKEEKSTRYFLSAKHLKNEISLTDKEVIILTNEPCRIVLHNDLFLFDDVDAKKLLPFFRKTHIEIPKSAEKKWFETFALKAIDKYEVKAEGFKIAVLNPEKSATATLEKDWNENYVLILRFKYNQYEFLPSNSKKSIVKFDIENFCFSKINRDFKWENAKMKLLLSKGFLKNDENNFVTPVKAKDKCDQQAETIRWLNINFDIFENGEIEFKQSFSKKKYFTQKISTDIKIDTKNDWFDIYGIVKFGQYEFPFIELKENILEKKSEFKLPDGTIAIIPEEWFSKYTNIFLHGKEKNKGLVLKKYHYGALEDTEEEIKGIDKKLFLNLNILSDINTDSVEVPEQIRADLRPYQTEGLQWLSLLQQNKFGACLADDMGLGKTLQAICLLQSTINERKKNVKAEPQNELFPLDEEKAKYVRKPSIVISPVSLIHNWENEIMKFSPFLKILKYRGPNRHKKIEKFSEYDIILTGYGVIRNDIELIENYEFLYIILDESQYIKNPDSKIFKAVAQLISEYKLILTGTPVENSLTDLWAQMDFLNEGMLGDRTFFKYQFLTPIEKENDEVQHLKLKKLINPFILRRTKEEVAKDLPSLTEQIILCRMTDEQSKVYNEEKSKVRNELIDSLETGKKQNNSMLVIQALTKLRQLANHPKLVDPGYDDLSGKYKDVIRAIENLIAEKHKVLIFSNFVKHLNLFADYFVENDYEYSILTGRTANREEVIRDFQNNPENRLFLISIKAGGTGLNLTEADYVIILDPWWNPAVEKQAVNRAHRIGQDKKVMVYKYITRNTVEEKIKDMQERKQLLSDSLITTDSPLKELTKDKIVELFQ